jgi:hypothetical protein
MDMTKKTKKHVVFIDSVDRAVSDHPTPSSYRIRFPRTYRNIFRGVLAEAIIPESFDQWGPGAYIRLGVLGVAVQEIPIPAMSYSGVGGGAALSASLRSGLESAYVGKTFQVDYLSGIGNVRSLSISCDQGDTLIIEVGVDPISSEYAGYLGFSETTSGTTLVSRHLNFRPISYLIMDVSPLNHVEEGGLGSHDTGRRCFAKIPFVGTDLDRPSHVLFSDGVSGNVVDLDPPSGKIDFLDVSFRTHTGRSIDFKNVDHCFTLHLYELLV